MNNILKARKCRKSGLKNLVKLSKNFLTFWLFSSTEKIQPEELYQTLKYEKGCQNRLKKAFKTEKSEQWRKIEFKTPCSLRNQESTRNPFRRTNLAF